MKTAATLLLLSVSLSATAAPAPAGPLPALGSGSPPPPPAAISVPTASVSPATKPTGTLPMPPAPASKPVSVPNPAPATAAKPPTPGLPPPPPPPAISGTKPASPPQPPPPPPPAPPEGLAIAKAGPHSVPVAGLNPDDAGRFATGKTVFLETETPATGLGPLFNDVSCVACHFEGGAGGGSRVAVTRFGRVLNGVHDPLENLGGPLLQRKATRQSVRETIPVEANTVVSRITTPLFGAGLLEAVPDETIRALAAAVKPDGVQGRAAEIVDPITGEKRIGRFGWKAQHASLDSFAADAYLNEMGITSTVFPVENAPNGKTQLLVGEDLIADPEDVATGTAKPDFVLTAEFMRLLAPVPRDALGGAKATSALQGERVFAEIGCTSCHTPALQTGVSPISALSQKPVRAYSDLLLHDMGSLGDGLAQGAAGLTEMRTAPLWGLRLRKRYLHDGRASTLELAITAHDGEARTAKDRFTKLSPANRAALLSFLNAL